jgi:hypothetical protein
MTDRIHRTCQVIEATTLRWTFEGGILDATHQALAALCHVGDNQMEHSQYRHFLSRACEGFDIVVLPARGRDHAGCLSDQVKLTHALNKELDQAMKDIHQLGDQGEEAGQRIIELESLYKQHEEAITKLKQENTSLELGIQSCDELILEIATEMGLDRTGEDNNEEDSEDKDDDDDGGDAATAPAAAPPATATPEMVVEDEEDPDMTILEQEVLKALEIILSDEEPELP